MRYLDATKQNRAPIQDKMDRAPVADKSDPSSPPKAPAGSGHPTEREPESTPAAARLATDSGIDLAKIQGTGSDGRITVVDVQNAIDAAKPPADQES